MDERSYRTITNADLKRLGQIAAQDRNGLFQRKPELGLLYSKGLIAVALCQGAALYYLDDENGIKDFDVWSFYQAAGARPYPYRRRGVEVFFDPKFGKLTDSPHFVGRRVDLLGRSIEVTDISDPVAILCRYLASGKTESSRFLENKAVILIEPPNLLGSVVWPTKAPQCQH